MKRPDYSHLGKMLVAMGYISREKLHRAIRLQLKTPTEPLGKILVDLKYISQDILEDVLHQQKKLRSKQIVDRAQGMAALAIGTCNSVIDTARNLQKKSAYVRKKTTGEGYPAVKAEIKEE